MLVLLLVVRLWMLQDFYCVASKDSNVPFWVVGDGWRIVTCPLARGVSVEVHGVEVGGKVDAIGVCWVVAEVAAAFVWSAGGVRPFAFRIVL